jgi:hypothetical protein
MVALIVDPERMVQDVLRRSALGGSAGAHPVHA